MSMTTSGAGNSEFFLLYPDVKPSDFDGPWYEPKARRGSRKIAEANMGSHRISTVISGYEAELESLTEFRVERILQANPKTKDVIEQQPVVRYFDFEGVRRQHTFDFLWLLNDGLRVAVQVKPLEAAKKHNTDALMDLIASQMSPTIADGTLLMTDKDATDTAGLMANRIVYALSREDAAPDDEIFAKTVLCLSGPITLKQMREISGLEGGTPYAAERAVGRGQMSHIEGPHGGTFFAREAVVK